MQLTSIRSGMLMRALTSAPFSNLKLNSGFSAFVKTPCCDRQRNQQCCLRDRFIICFSQHLVDGILVVFDNCLYDPSEGTIAFKTVTSASIATASATATSPAASVFVFVSAPPGSSASSVAPTATSPFARRVADFISILIYEPLPVIFQFNPFLGFETALWVTDVYSIP